MSLLKKTMIMVSSLSFSGVQNHNVSSEATDPFYRRRTGTNGVSTHHQKATDQIKAVFSPSVVVLIMTLATGTVDVLSDHIL